MEQEYWKISHIIISCIIAFYIFMLYLLVYRIKYLNKDIWKELGEPSLFKQINKDTKTALKNFIKNREDIKFNDKILTITVKLLKTNKYMTIVVAVYLISFLLYHIIKYKI